MESLLADGVGIANIAISVNFTRFEQVPEDSSRASFAGSISVAGEKSFSLDPSARER